MIPVYFSGVKDSLITQILNCAKNLPDSGADDTPSRFRLEYIADSHAEMSRVAAKLETTSVIFIGVTGSGQKQLDEAADLASLCLRNNRDHYLFYVLPNASLLVDLVPRMFGIFGILITPAEDAQITQSLQKIVDDIRLMDIKDGSAQSPFVVLRYLGSIVRLPPENILFVEAQDKKLMIHQPDRAMSIYNSMGKIKERLGNSFFHCHRSYLVNVDAIRSINLTRMEIELVNGAIVPISRTYRQQAVQLAEQMQNEALG